MTNRILKFRVWDKTEKVFITHYKNNNYRTPQKNNSIWELVYYFLSNYDFRNEENYIFEQFTGVKDKNGKEIYEGDTVECYSSNGEKAIGKIVWKNEICGFAFKRNIKNNKTRDWACLWDFSNFKII